ncbi:MAG TPA: hypothetical protein VJ617_19905 [Arthrobacter sp.]|nr:hypothetical protein [Arthrobacter sp.]
MDCPFTIKVYDKDFNFKCYIGDPRTVVATPRYNSSGTLRIDLTSDHPRIADLSVDGARVVCEYYGEHILSGPVTAIAAQGPSSAAVIAFYVDDDFRLFEGVLGWPNPTQAITSQTSEYYKLTGPAETVVKDLITKNAITRLGMPVTCASNLARGATISVALRMDPLADKLFPAVEQAGIGVSVKQSGAGLLVDCYVPATFPRILTEESGIVQDWSWTSTRATNTRVVIGGEGEATARVFAIEVAVNREPRINDKMEVFRDARDADSSALLSERGRETLAEGAAKSGFSLTLAETDNFRYGGKGVRVGDSVTVSIGGVERTDILREATISYSYDDGLSITPVIGEIQDNPDRTIASFLKSVRKGLAELKAGT